MKYKYNKGAKLFTLLLLLLLQLPLFAQTATSKDRAILLQSGKVVYGTILFQSNEVVIIKTPEGDRFQYPISDIAEIKPWDNTADPPLEPSVPKEASPVAMQLSLFGGATYLSTMEWAPSMQASLMVGTRSLMDKLLLGGTIGLSAAFAEQTTYAFLPLSLHAATNRFDKKTAPYFALDLGYGFSLANRVKGGLYCKLGVGTQFRLTPKSSLRLSAQASLQQAKTDNRITVGDPPQNITYYGDFTLLQLGVGVAILF